MTDHYRVRIQGPPLTAGVVNGDVVSVPALASDVAGGAPFWLRVTETGPVVDTYQDVTGVRISSHRTASKQPEAERIVHIRLPLERAARRVFVPAEHVRTPAVGRAQVGATLPRRSPGPPHPAG